MQTTSSTGGCDSYRLFWNNIVPVAVLNDLVAVSNEDFTFADSDIGRVKLVERSTLNGDSGSVLVITVQRPSRVDALKSAAFDGDLRIVLCIIRDSAEPAGAWFANSPPLMVISDLLEAQTAIA